MSSTNRNTARYQANLQLVTISEVVSLPAVEINDVSASYFVPFLIGDIEVKDARKHHQSEINQFANVVVTVDTTKEMPEDVCPSPSPSSIWDIWYAMVSLMVWHLNLPAPSTLLLALELYKYYF